MITNIYWLNKTNLKIKIMSKLKGPDGRIPDRLPDGRPAVAWERRWTEGTLPLWLVATAGGMQLSSF